MSNNNKKPALGRGLSALLENARTDITSKHMGEGAPTVNSVSTIKIKSILKLYRLCTSNDTLLF